MSLRNALMVALLLNSAAALAATPNDVGQGLGTAQPLTNDVSLSSHWHVYRFIKQGVEYLQVNDASGQVHMAIGTANGTLIVLPVGSDAQNISTSDAPLNIAVTGSQTVYEDAQVTLTVGVSASGALIWSATTAATDGDCDPNDCGINRVTAATPTTATTSTASQPIAAICDTNDCGINRVVKQTVSTSQATEATSAQSTCDPNDCGINRQP
jgi:hypothetical protein